MNINNLSTGMFYTIGHLDAKNVSPQSDYLPNVLVDQLF